MTYEHALILLFAAIVVVVLLGLLVAMVAGRWGQPRRPRARPGARRGKPPGAPAAGARFFCVHCAGQFRHTPRTLKAWQRGSRRFFCDSCQAARARELQEAPFGVSTQAPGDELDPRG